jgi:hypothetical protein
MSEAKTYETMSIQELEASAYRVGKVLQHIEELLARRAMEAMTQPAQSLPTGLGPK